MIKKKTKRELDIAALARVIRLVGRFGGDGNPDDMVSLHIDTDGTDAVLKDVDGNEIWTGTARSLVSKMYERLERSKHDEAL